MRHGLYGFSTPTDRDRIDNGKLYSHDGRHCGSLRGWVSHRLWQQEVCDRCQAAWLDYRLKAPPDLLALASAIGRRFERRQRKAS
jgi:hypothetical protein